MRGDRPGLDIRDFLKEEFTPHARGSTRHCRRRKIEKNVYPACAGIDLGLGFGLIWLSSLPRMRGDRPGYAGFVLSPHLFTPHARGSTH